MKIPYTEEAPPMFVSAFNKVLTEVTGMRAPVRKRRRRCQKKIDRRNGAMHFAPWTMDQEPGQ